MGEFISFSGVIQATASEVEGALRSYCAAKGGSFNPAGPETDDGDVLGIAQSATGISVIYPENFFGWDDASEYVSLCLHRPVFSLHIHDGDLWMFILYVEGENVARFNPIPGYWDDNISPEEENSWRGDAQEIAKHVPGLRPESIERYFRSWDLDDETPGKAYPDDETSYLDCWQIVDFMRKLGLPYASEDSSVVSSAYEFKVKR
jgi:hypothetical protein